MAEILDVFGIDLRLLGIQVINFGLMLLVLWYFLYRPLVKLLDDRKKKIADSIEKAEQVDRAHNALAEEKKLVLADANKEAEGIVKRSKETGNEQAAGIVRAAHEKSERMFSDAQQRAQEEKQRAIKESEQEVAKLAVLAAEKVLRERTG